MLIIQRNTTEIFPYRRDGNTPIYEGGLRVPIYGCKVQECKAQPDLQTPRNWEELSLPTSYRAGGGKIVEMTEQLNGGKYGFHYYSKKILNKVGRNSDTWKYFIKAVSPQPRSGHTKGDF